mgnify:FL=1
MDKENSLSELDADQAETVDKLIGRKIWNIEIIEDEEEAVVKILFSEAEDDYMMIHASGMTLYVIEPKPKALH